MLKNIAKYQELYLGTDEIKYVPCRRSEKPEELLPGRDKDKDRKKEKEDKWKGSQGTSANGSGGHKHSLICVL